MTVKANDLVISTYGRGFWILDDLTPLRQVRRRRWRRSMLALFYKLALRRRGCDGTTRRTRRCRRK